MRTAQPVRSSLAAAQHVQGAALHGPQGSAAPQSYTFLYTPCLLIAYKSATVIASSSSWSLPSNRPSHSMRYVLLACVLAARLRDMIAVCVYMCMRPAAGPQARGQTEDIITDN